jgi:hypothetical protein
MKSLYIGVPSHDHKVEVSFFCGAINVERALFAKEKTPIQWSFNSGESLVQRCRNNIAHTFLHTKCAETKDYFSHLLMIDTDMDFEAWQVKALLDACNDQHPIVAGMAPKKYINWSRVHKAVKNGAKPNDLASHASVNVVNKLDDFDYSTEDDVVPVKYAGTGMMCITRKALLDFAAAYPELKYNPDYTIGDSAFDKNTNAGVTAFFDCIICPEEGRYLSEDYTFCKRARAIGLETYVHRKVIVGHIGKINYQPNPHYLE